MTFGDGIAVDGGPSAVEAGLRAALSDIAIPGAADLGMRGALRAAEGRSAAIPRGWVAARGTAGDGTAGDLAAVSGAEGDLTQVVASLRTMAGLDVEDLDVDRLGGLVESLGRVEALVAAAVSRAISLAEAAGCAEADGQASAVDWVAGRLRTSSTAAARTVRLAAGLDGMPAVLDALGQATISRDHAIELVAAARRRQADHDAAERARRVAQDEGARRAREAAEVAARQAADAAEADRIRQQALAAEQATRAVAEAERHSRAQQRAADDAAHAAALLDRAASGASPDQLKDAAADVRAGDPDALLRAEAAQWARRSVRRGIDHDTGLGWTRALLPVVQHELLGELLDAARTFDPPETPPADRRTFEQRQADALIDLLGLIAKAVDLVDDGTLGTSRGQKPHGTITMPHDVATGATDGTATTRGGATISGEQARRHACDSQLTAVLLNQTGMVLQVGRATRRWTSAQYKAADVTFGGCGFPIADGQMCGRPLAWCDLHHVTWWRDGGRTDTDNAVPLCHRHHEMVHHRQWTLAYDHHDQQITLTRRRADGTTTTRTVHLARPAADAPRASGHPAIARPSTAQPTTAQPTTAQPSNAQPTTAVRSPAPDRLPI